MTIPGSLFVVNVIIPNAKTLTTRVVADSPERARFLAVTRCPQAKNTLAYGEVVKCFAPLVGTSLPSSAPARPARRHPSLQEGGRRPRKNVAPVVAPVLAKRIPAQPGRAFSSDDLSLVEAFRSARDDGETAEWVEDRMHAAALVARRVAAEIAAEIDREEAGSVDGSNFLVSVGSAYAVEAEGWDGWKVTR